MTVKEYALRQLHWIVRRDPWVREIFLAAGVSLDEMAERIVAIYNFDNFAALTAAQCAYYEGLRPDQIIYLNPGPEMPLDEAIRITGGHRLVICDAIEAPRKPSA